VLYYVNINNKNSKTNNSNKTEEKDTSNNHKNGEDNDGSVSVMSYDILTLKLNWIVTYPVGFAPFCSVSQDNTTVWENNISKQQIGSYCP